MITPEGGSDNIGHNGNKDIMTAITDDIARRINDAAAQMTDELVEWRRDFHRYPELGFQGTAPP